MIFFSSLSCFGKIDENAFDNKTGIERNTILSIQLAVKTHVICGTETVFIAPTAALFVRHKFIFIDLSHSFDLLSLPHPTPPKMTLQTDF